jgi:hypothetical protein
MLAIYLCYLIFFLLLFHPQNTCSFFLFNLPILSSQFFLKQKNTKGNLKAVFILDGVGSFVQVIT